MTDDNTPTDIPVTEILPGDETPWYRVLHVYPISDGVRLHVRFLTDGGDDIRDFDIGQTLPVTQRFGTDES